MVRQYVLHQAQWKIDRKCVGCGIHNPDHHICADCVKQRSRDQVKRWAKANPVGMKAHAHAARARKVGLAEHFSAREWQDLCRSYGDVCLRCHKKKSLVPDHVIPLGQEESTNTIENIQPLCRSCNSVKNSKRTDYRIGASTFDLPTVYLLPRLMKLDGGIYDRFFRVD